jgi:signal transduction histidine kinase
MPRTLRGRVAALAFLTAAVVLAVVGTVVVASFSDREHETLDRRLVDLPPGRVLRPFSPAVPTDGHDPGGGDEFARVLSGRRVVMSAETPTRLPLPTGPGLRTVTADGTRFRVAARERGDRLVEVGTDLGPLEERVDGLRNRVILLSALGAALCGLAAWWLAGLALRPLAGLRAAAARVSTTRDLSTRLPDTGGPEEVDTLSSTVNAMLARLQRSAGEADEALEATRRFAADAGHELRTPLTALRANAGSLLRNPDMPAAQRQAILAELDAEADRTVRVLGALQTLARGDAAAALPRERLDLAQLADLAIDHARRRHPGVDFALSAPPEVSVEGWPDGLRAVLDNLLDNAATHGRPGGRVALSIAREGDVVALTVDDDGPGLADADRERVFGRFERADGAGEGSGLGLALVRQQAALHGGRATLDRSPLGGLRATVELGAAGSVPPA